MIIKRVEICNLYSYRKAVFDFTGNGGPLGLHLIHGRNGFGKTSFLNAVKLLMHGPSGDFLNVAGANRKLTVTQFVRGSGSDWQGLLNFKARREKIFTCYVEMDWSEPGLQVRAKRTWDLKLKGESELFGALHLRITPKGGQIENMDRKEAQNFIDRRITKDAMAFFFFDGEKIAQLAGANDRQKADQLERLLDLSKYELISKELGTILRELKHKLQVDADHEKLAKAKSELQEASRKKKTYVGKKNRLEQEIASGKKELAELRAKEKGFYADIQDSSGRDFSKELEENEQVQIENLGRLKESMPAWPLLANAKLMARTIKTLNKAMQDRNSEQVALLEGLRDGLPKLIYDDPPAYLDADESQNDYYRARLVRQLDSRIGDYEGIGTSKLRLQPAKAQTLIRTLTQAGKTERARLANYLDNFLKRSIFQQDLEGQAANQVRATKEFWDDHNELREKIERLSKQISLHERELDVVKATTSGKRLNIEIHNLVREFDKLERASATDKRNQAIYQRYWDLRDAISKVKAKVKKRVVQDLNKHTNVLFEKLMTSHRQIKEIILSPESLTWDLIGQDGQQVGKGNISSGMKQQVATAMVWAFQEIADTRLPVIVDTPLARIDRQHQEVLLKQYYPKIDQVIILPTHSELDAKKYQLIKPHLKNEFSLVNPTGESTTVEQKPMY